MKRLIIPAWAMACSALVMLRASAVPTIAAWDGDFATTTKDNVTLNLQGNAVNDGVVTIGARGLLLSCTADKFTDGVTNAAITVIADVEDIPVPSSASATNTLCSVVINSTIETTFDALSDGRFWIGWQHGENGFARSTVSVPTGRHRISFTYGNKGKGQFSTVDGSRVCTASMTSSEGVITHVRVGEYANGTCVAVGMKVHKLAVIKGFLSDAEIAAYEWDVPPSHFGRYKDHFGDRVMTWTARGSALVNMAENSGTFRRLDLETGAPTGAVFMGATETTDLPGCPEATVAWRGFASAASSGYVAPGLVLRFSPYVGGANLRSRGAFNPLSLGGLIVEEGADNGSFAVELCDNENEYRTTDFGDPTGTVPTWFVIRDDFRQLRKGKLTLHGEINFDIAAGKTCDVTTANDSAEVALKGGAEMKMHGGGTFKVRTLTAVSESGEAVALDYSDLPLGRSTPFIDGDLTIDSSTRIAFPAGLQPNVEYQLCSGTLVAPSEPYRVLCRIGTETISLILTASGNSVSYAGQSVATVDGVSYNTVQEAFDAATASSEIVVNQSGAVVLAADKVVKSLTAYADVDLSGSGVLTIPDEGAIFVESEMSVNFRVAVLLSGTAEKTGLGTVEFSSTVGKGAGQGKLLVRAGHANFDASVDGVEIAGCGSVSSEAKWPVITLKSGCVVSDSALISPVMADTGARYGKVVQDGASVSHKSGQLNLMKPNGGGGRYVMNSGTFDLGSSQLALQYESGSIGFFQFDQNGGTLTAGGIVICRRGIDASNERYKYVLNGGTLNSYFTGAVNSGKAGFDEKCVVLLQGGTYNVGGQTNLCKLGTVSMSVSNSVSFANSGSTETVANTSLKGRANVTFIGTGSLDFSDCTDFCGSFTVLSGVLRLGHESLDAASVVDVAQGAKLGLDFDGERPVKSLKLGDKVRSPGLVYGYGRGGSGYFEALAGAVRPSEGVSCGFILIYR